MKKVEGLNIAMGQTLKELRVKKNMSQEKLAELCDTSSVYISEIERGIKNPTIQALMVISSAFNMKLSDLIRMLESEVLPIC